MKADKPLSLTPQLGGLRRLCTLPKIMGVLFINNPSSSSQKGVMSQWFVRGYTCTTLDFSKKFSQGFRTH